MSLISSSLLIVYEEDQAPPTHQSTGVYCCLKEDLVTDIPLMSSDTFRNSLLHKVQTDSLNIVFSMKPEERTAKLFPDAGSCGFICESSVPSLDLCVLCQYHNVSVTVWNYLKLGTVVPSVFLPLFGMLW